MSTPDNSSEIVNLSDLRLSRRLLRGGSFGVCALLLCILVSLGIRGRLQQSRVEELLRFEVSVQAQYGDYKYSPPPTASAAGDSSRLTIVWGRGQRVIGFSVVDDPPPYLMWLVSIVGEQCFAQVTDISIHDERFADADVKLLLAFSELRAIDLSGTAITDDGLAALASIERLAMLNISGTQVSAESLRRLANSKNLKELDIRETNANEQVVEYLVRKLPDCSIQW